MNTAPNPSRDGWSPGLVGRCTAQMAGVHAETFGLGAVSETNTTAAMARFVHAVPASAPRSPQARRSR
jgi:hypothetical protein